MRTIAISDVTLRCSAGRSDLNLSFREKIEAAKLLDRLNADVIELPSIQNDKADALLIKSIASCVRESIVSVSAALSEEGVRAAWDALREAARPRLQIAVPTSAVQMEYVCNKKPPMVLAMISALVAEAKKLCADVEFVAEDATRATPDFLRRALEAACAAGATVVTVCDDAGITLPEEFAAFVAGLRENVPELQNVTLGVFCGGELGMAAACAASAAMAGAGELKTSCVLEDVTGTEDAAQFLRLRGGSCGLKTNLRVTELRRAAEQLRWIAHSKRSKTTPFENGVQSEAETGDLTLSSFDDAAAVARAVRKLGYDLSEDDAAKVFEEFGRIAAKKGSVGAKELDAIVASAALQVPPTYRLVSYVINCGNVISATAHIQLEKDGKTVSVVSVGDGPIDAAFLAIEQIVGHHFELDDFQIQTVTEGREAMGSALVKLRSEGKLYSGKGISTDIIGASIRAYLNALNKIVYEEV